MQTKGLTDKSKLTRFELIFLILAASVTITFVSTSSPLYPFNPWDDVNVFFTLGRGIKHGLVPYKDIFDHKGPLLYFIYFLAVLISEKSFVGVWLIECIAASVYAVFSWKTAKLFTAPSKIAIIMMPLFLGIVYTSRMFNFGGNTEELCMPLLTVALYFGLKAIVNGDGLPSKAEALICGLISGALFWLKYTFLGFMIGFCLYILVLSIRHKDFAKLWSLVWRFIAGFVIVCVPVLAYFAMTGALSYLWEAYFYVNIFLYKNDPGSDLLSQIPVIKNIYIPLRSIALSGWLYKAFGIMLILTLVSLFCIDKKYRKKTLFLFFATLIFSAGFIFTRFTFIYYYAYLLYYCFAFALIPCIKGISKAESAFKQNPDLMKILVSSVFIILYIASVFLSKNMYLIFKSKTALAQFLMAETINSTPDAKVLTYDVMDAGFYTAAGIMPCNRYCAAKQFGDSYPQLTEEQDRLISEGYFDYIVTTYFCEEEWDNYELVQEEAVPFVDFTGETILDAYRLYKRI
jgi:hypothetical protein